MSLSETKRSGTPGEWIAVGLLILLVLMPLGMVLSAWVITIMWSWFVVPVFALPLLTKAQALGLSLLVGYITWQYTNTNSDSESGPWKWFGRAVGLAIFRPLLVLAISWVVHLFL